MGRFTRYFLALLFGCSLTGLSVDAGAQQILPLPAGSSNRDLNAYVLEAIRTMPEGGSYATNATAKSQLIKAVTVNDRGLFLAPEVATPSFCSGATYLVLLRALEFAAQRGGLEVEAEALAALAVKGQRDGEGIWGRWNANGPGTARLFHELGLGRSFTDYADARPGDFMKIFWSQEIGKLERGHSVVYLGTETVGGVERVKFWSSNKPAGYGVKSVPKKQVIRAIFTRLENPSAVNRAPALPKSDRFLAEMLVKRFSMADVAKNCGF
jgi:hypothetical protein